MLKMNLIDKEWTLKYLEYMKRNSDNLNLYTQKIIEYKDIDNTAQGNIIDFVYAGSKYKELKYPCESKTMPEFSQENQSINSFSSRSLVYMIESPLSSSTTDPKPGEIPRGGTDGYLSRGVLMIRLMTSISDFHLRNIKPTLSEDLDGNYNLKVSFQASGCFQVTKGTFWWKYTHELDNYEGFWSDSSQINLDPTIGALTDNSSEISISFNKLNPQNPISFKIEIECDPIKIEDRIFPWSNQMLSRSPGNQYKVNNGPYSLGDMRVTYMKAHYLQPDKMKDYIFDLTDNYIIKFMKKEVPITFFKIIGGSALTIKLIWREVDDGSFGYWIQVDADKDLEEFCMLFHRGDFYEGVYQWHYRAALVSSHFRNSRK